GEGRGPPSAAEAARPQGGRVGAGEGRRVRRYGDRGGPAPAGERLVQTREQRVRTEVVDRHDRRRGLHLRSDARADDQPVEPPTTRLPDRVHRGGPVIGTGEVRDYLRVAEIDAEDALAGALQPGPDGRADSRRGAGDGDRPHPRDAPLTARDQAPRDT